MGTIERSMKAGPATIQGIRLMLLCCLLTAGICTRASAQQTEGADRKVSVSCTKEPLTKVLDRVERLSGYYKFNFSYDALSQYKVTADIHEKKVPEAVDQLLKGLPLEKRISGRFIQIVPAEESAKVQILGTVKGSVVDEEGMPLAGATVRIKGSNRGMATDADGRFELHNVEGGTMIAISFIGKKEVERKVSFVPFRVVLADDANALEDVVVTGYQSISKERSAGAYSIVKGEDIAGKVLSTNSVIDGLEGLTTGLNVSRNTGADKYLIRGTTSINSTRSPLFVVDGVPLDESLVEDMINSNDIQSVTVLKDATAASIWGSQAANGVIVITTKRGEQNQKVKVSYNGSFTLYGKPDYGYYNYMSGKDFLRNAQEMFDAYADTYTYGQVQNGPYGAIHNLCYHGYTPVLYPHEVPMYQYKAGTLTQTQRDAELSRLAVLDGRGQYEDYFMSDKLFTQHNVSLRGGSTKHTYFLSLSYKGDQGSAKDWTDKFTLNAYQDFQLTNWMKWDFTVNANYGNRTAHLNPWYSASTVEDIANAFNQSSGAKYSNLPYNIFRDADGWVDQSAMVLAPSARQKAEGVSGVDLSFYPVEDFNSSVNKTTNTNIRINTGLSLKLLKGLDYEGRFQYSRIHSRTETYRPSEAYLVREERAQTYNPTAGAMRVPNTGGHYMLNNALTTDWTLRNQLTYNNTLNDDLHQITALAGTEIRSYCYTSYVNHLRGYNMQTMQAQSYDNYALQGFLMPVLLGSRATVSSWQYNQSEVAKKYFSLYANAAYTYNRKYTVNASLRIDQSNLFGSDPSNQYKPIWSVGAAWKMSDESFMDAMDFVDELKLRASFGLAGNSPKPGTGGKYDILEATSSFRFETPGFNIITPANDLLTWEKTRIINAGFDVRLLQNRLSLSLDWYSKYTKDLIGTVNLNPTTGWQATTGNLGEMSNRGFEIALNTHNIASRHFNWYTTLTLSHNKNKVEKLDVEVPITLASDMINQYYVEGYAMGTLFSYRYAGLDSEGRPQAYDKDGNIVTGYDTQRLTKDDVVYSGTTIPKFYGGLTNRLVYKNLELSFMFVYNLGHKMRQDGIYFYGRPGCNLPEEFDRRWRQPGDEAWTDVPKYTVRYDSNLNADLYYKADTRVLDASYIRLRDLSISYALPRAFCRKMKTESIKLTAQVGNLFLIAFNGEGIDPEAYNYTMGSYSSRQDKYGPSYSVGLNINF